MYTFVTATNLCNALGINFEPIYELSDQFLSQIPEKSSLTGFKRPDQTERLLTSNPMSSPKSRKKLSNSLKSRWAMTQHPNKGKITSEETKEKLRQVRLGKTLTVDIKEKISVYRTGRKMSEETKRKIGEANKGRKRPDLSDYNRNRTKSHSL